MKQTFVTLDSCTKNRYISAASTLEKGEQIRVFYLEPGLFHNENGPAILAKDPGDSYTCCDTAGNSNRSSFNLHDSYSNAPEHFLSGVHFCTKMFEK